MTKGRDYPNRPLRMMFFIALIIIGFVVFANVKSMPKINFSNNPALKAKIDLPDYVGEKISYDIKLGAFTIGTSSFNYVSKTQINGRLLNLMTLETKIPQFSDLEKIYSDPETSLPIKVEREISGLLRKEVIVEDYDQKNFTVNISRKTLLNTQKTALKRSGPIQNAILLPHYIRRMPNLAVGQTIPVNLPKYELKITLESIETIEIPAGSFKAYHFISTPRQVEIWITADERKIPIKLQGVGNYVYLMVMKEYTP